MSIKEIEKLREKVDKDPNSKLFVPLAEEYKKEGMTEEAIAVLQKGLQKQPGYMSARVSLGKIYLEKGNMDEARVEFESVIKTIPDNLYAHKKLAEIYRDTGERDLAIKAFRTVIKLNPMDEEILSNLRDIEGASTEHPAEIILETGVSPEKENAAAEEIPFEAMRLEHTSHEDDQGGPAHSAEELDSFKEALFGFKAEKEEGKPEELPIAEESIAEAEEDIEEVKETQEEAAEEWSFDEAGSAPAAGIAEEDIAEAEDISEEAEEKLSFGDIADVLKTEGFEAVEEAETISENNYASEKMFSAELPSETACRSLTDNSALLQTADRFISEENYSKALDVYRQMLATTPEDKHTLQRLEELKSLLKLLGRDKEVLISKLEAFLSAIKKRGDEFFRSS